MDLKVGDTIKFKFFSGGYQIEEITEITEDKIFYVVIYSTDNVDIGEISYYQKSGIHECAEFIQDFPVAKTPLWRLLRGIE